jgi:LysM repeat protein
VANGDTLLDIATRFNTTVDELSRLNGLTNAGRLSIGQELVLDPAPPAGSAAGGANAPAPARTYTVREGDTLWDIAARTGTAVDDLLRLNSITASTILRLGQELVLSDGAAAPDAAALPPAPRKHTVVSGDTLVDIAARYGTTASELQRLNNLSATSLLGVGQELELP